MNEWRRPAYKPLSLHTRANDDPRGVFKLKSGAQKVKVNTVSWTRSFEFTVARGMGAFGNVQVDYELTHSDWYLGNEKGTVSFQDQVNEVGIMLFLCLPALPSSRPSFSATLRQSVGWSVDRSLCLIFSVCLMSSVYHISSVCSSARSLSCHLVWLVACLFCLYLTLVVIFVVLRSPPLSSYPMWPSCPLGQVSPSL